MTQWQRSRIESLWEQSSLQGGAEGGALSSREVYVSWEILTIQVGEPMKPEGADHAGSRRGELRSRVLIGSVHEAHARILARPGRHVSLSEESTAITLDVSKDGIAGLQCCFNPSMNYSCISIWAKARSFGGPWRRDRWAGGAGTSSIWPSAFTSVCSSMLPSCELCRQGRPRLPHMHVQKPRVTEAFKSLCSESRRMSWIRQVLKSDLNVNRSFHPLVTL